MLRKISSIKVSLIENIRAIASTAASIHGDPISPILTKEVNRCGIVELNRPNALNALNLDMIRAIHSTLQGWQQPTERKSLVILKSGHTNTFCAGGDVQEMISGTLDQLYAFYREEYRLMHLIGTYRVPNIALVNGLALGAGVALSVHSLYRVCTEKTIISMPGTTGCLSPGEVGSYFLPRLNGELGTYMALTGATLKGWDIFGAGIATHYCHSDRLEDLECSLLQCRSDADVQHVLDRHCEPWLTEPPEFSLAFQQRQIDRCFAANTVGKVLRNLEADGCDWSLKTLDQLRSVSPVCLKVTLRLLRIARKLSLAECLQMEHRILRRYNMNNNVGDMREGILAKILKTDETPNYWRFERLEDVPDEYEKQFFEPFERHEDELSLV